MWWRRRTQESPLTARERRDESISAYLDDEISEAERAEIEALIAEDPDARDALNDLRLLTIALHSLGEVPAPRSFAIPAPAIGMLRSTVFRRLELGIRASAAAAALFFVVALVNQPSGLLVGTSAQDDATAMEAAAPAGEALRASDGAFAAGASSLAAPETTANAGDEPQGTPVPNDLSTGSSLEMPRPEPAGAQDAATESAVEAGVAKAADAMPGSDAAFGSPMPGTSGLRAASDGVGGVAPALAALAVLLTVLSVLVTRGRRSGSAGRQ